MIPSMLTKFQNLSLNYINFRKPTLLTPTVSNVIFKSPKIQVTAPASVAVQMKPVTLLSVLSAGRQQHLKTAQEVFSGAAQKSKSITQR